jgi:SAM-dependent methyltransferase
LTFDYDSQAAKWHRDEPKHQSDFCGRPEVFDLCKKLGQDKVVLDVGCGEGYFSRKLSSIASRVVGVDISEGMLRLAVEKEQKEKRGIEYHLGDVRNMPFHDSTFDLCVGNYITNYFKPGQLLQFYQELTRVTNDNGRFILLMPHPFFELIEDYGEAIRYEVNNYDYVRSRGELFTAALGTAEGDTLNIGSYHTTLEDHFNALSSAGLRVNDIKEPVFPEALAEKYSVFEKMGGKVTCMILVGEK